MATPCVFCFVFTISLFSFTQSNPILDKVVESIEKYVQYTLNHTGEVELFTLHSLKVVEGTTQHLLSEKDEDYILPRLTTLQDEIAKLRAQTIHNVDEEELRGRWRLVNDPWIPPKSYRVITEEYRWKKPGGSDIDHGKLSAQLGKCMMEVVARKRMVPSKQHRVEKKCVSRDLMLTKLSSGNLHLQLAFFLYTEMYGFKEFVNAELMKMKIMGGIKEVQLELCTNAFFELRKGMKKGIFNDDNTLRLYADYAFYCSATGFMQFLHVDYLDQMLAYQLPTGCFMSRTQHVCDPHYSAAMIPVLSMYMLLAAEPGSAAHQEHVNITGINFIKDGVPIPSHIVDHINGPLPQLGGPPRAPRKVSEGRWLNVGQLGVAFVVVLILGTGGVLWWIRRQGGGADGGWRLPDKHKHH